MQCSCLDEERVNETNWADVLAPFPITDSQQAYFDLTPESAHDIYDHKVLMVEILARLEVTLTMRVSCVHAFGFVKGKSAHAQLYTQIHPPKDWLQPEVLTPTNDVERVALDCFLSSFLKELYHMVAPAEHQSLDEIAVAVEQYNCTEDFLGESLSTRELLLIRR